MATSQNGWPVIDKSSSPHLTKIPKIIGKVRKDGGVAEIFTDLIDWFDTYVEDVDKGRDDWGWAHRPIRGKTKGFSNHASGCAIDLNAMLHPRGAVNTFTPAQRNAIRKRLSEKYKGVIRWGGDYNQAISKRDDMHFEIDASATRIKQVLESLGKEVDKPVNVKPKPDRPKPTTPPKTVWQNSKNSKEDNINIARMLNALGYNAGYPDGVPGTYLRDGVMAYQKDQIYMPGMKADGDWGSMMQDHYEWVKTLQDAMNGPDDGWAASNRLGWLAEDGDYKSLTGQHVMAIQKANPDLYRKAGGKVYDKIAGPVFCKMIGIKPHPSA